MYIIDDWGLGIMDEAHIRKDIIYREIMCFVFRTSR